jgi:Bacteriophage Lambda NinG protein
MQTACGSNCALELVAKTRAKLDKENRKADKIKRENLKTRSDYLKEAQIAFNRYVRLRDAGRPCICCGRPLAETAPGGSADAGHYRSVGSAPHLRFNEDNCHAQSKQCNRYGAGRAVDYRLGLIDRIGIARVEALEANKAVMKWTAAELIAIRDEYRAKAKQLLHNHS